jgi:hypothetical protein
MALKAALKCHHKPSSATLKPRARTAHDEAHRILTAAKSRGATTLTDAEQRAVSAAMRDYNALNERISQESEDVARMSRIPDALREAGTGGTGHRNHQRLARVPKLLRHRAFQADHRR